MEHEPPFEDELPVDFWDDVYDDEPIEPSRWRRGVLLTVALITVAAMALVPLYNLWEGTRPAIAANGLEVCRYDYCVVQDGITNAGLNLSMVRYSNTILDEDSARGLSSTLTSHLGLEPVSVVVVDRIAGSIQGQYDPGTRTMILERPVRAWTVMHEVAHAASTGHGDEFQAALISLTRWLDQQTAG